MTGQTDGNYQRSLNGWRSGKFVVFVSGDNLSNVPSTLVIQFDHVEEKIDVCHIL